jgi:tripeptidyl-peptidase I
MEDELLLRSSPKSPLYGQWLSNEAVHALGAPAAESVEALRSFLSDNGLEARQRTPNSDVLSVVATFAQAEALLNTTYYTHRHTTVEGLEVSRCDSYSLPEEVAKHVAFVGPATHFPSLRRPKASKDGSALYSNDPSNLRSLYGVGGAVGGPEARQAVTAFLGQYYRAADLTSFFQQYFPEGAATPIELVGDATEGLPAGIEAMLDIEYM